MWIWAFHGGSRNTCITGSISGISCNMCVISLFYWHIASTGPNTWGNTWSSQTIWNRLCGTLPGQIYLIFQRPGIKATQGQSYNCLFTFFNIYSIKGCNFSTKFLFLTSICSSSLYKYHATIPISWQRKEQTQWYWSSLESCYAQLLKNFVVLKSSLLDPILSKFIQVTPSQVLL